MTVSSELRIRALPGLGELQPGDDLAAVILQALAAARWTIMPETVFVVAQKIVSKVEGRVVALDSVEPSPLARRWAEACGKDPRLVELVLQQSRRIVRMAAGVLIAETHHGFICANAGVDSSNAPPGCAILLPADPDASAERLRQRLHAALGVPLGVIISDSFGRPWREGQVNVALGVAGVAPLRDYRGLQDPFGRRLQASVIATADELAAAAELVMGKIERRPVALIEGLQLGEPGTARQLLRRPEQDLFR
jgi:coenzyme F420-0:L-glutamate ligase/coenzyme F420-1:gamma-L-glutamate ligase